MNVPDPLAGPLLAVASARAAAGAWAAELSLPVEIGGVPDPPCCSSLPQAVVSFQTPHGPLEAHIPTHLIAGVAGALVGAPGRSAGPVALSAAEEGLLAFLALAWAAALPVPGLTLCDVSVRSPSGLAPALGTWHVAVGGPTGPRGFIRWCRPGGARHRHDVRAVPIPLRIHGQGLRFDPQRTGLRSGDLLPTHAVVFHLKAAGQMIHPLVLAGDGLHIGATPPEVIPMPLSLETLPCALTLDLGSVVLPAGRVADLAPGDRLPVALDSPPRVWLRAGDVLVAEGRLTTVDGQACVEIDRVLLPTST